MPSQLRISLKHSPNLLLIDYQQGGQWCFLFIIRFFVCSFDASGQDNHKMQKWADGQ